MAEAKKCDRCNRYYDPYKNDGHDGFTFTYDGVADCDLITDLCPECMASLNEWYENKEADK